MNIMTKATRPKTIPKSRITGSSRLRLRLALPPRRSCGGRRAASRRLGRGGGRRAGEHRAAVADGLVRESGERGHGRGQLAEPQLGPAAGRRPAEGAEQAAEEVPGRERLAERLHGGPEALDAPEEVGERRRARPTPPAAARASRARSSRCRWCR